MKGQEIPQVQQVNIHQPAPMNNNGQGIPMGVPMNYNSNQVPVQQGIHNPNNYPYNNPNSFGNSNFTHNYNSSPCACGGSQFRIEDNTNCLMMTLGITGLICCLTAFPFNLVFLLLMYWAMKGYKKRFCVQCNTELPFKNDLNTL